MENWEPSNELDAIEEYTPQQKKEASSTPHVPRIQKLAQKILKIRNVAPEQQTTEMLESTIQEIYDTAARVLDKKHNIIFDMLYLDEEKGKDIQLYTRSSKEDTQHTINHIRDAVVKGINDPYYHDPRVNQNNMMSLVQKVYKNDLDFVLSLTKEGKQASFAAIPARISKVIQDSLGKKHLRFFELYYIQNIADEDIYKHIETSESNIARTKKAISEIVIQHFPKPNKKSLYEAYQRRHNDIFIDYMNNMDLTEIAKKNYLPKGRAVTSLVQKSKQRDYLVNTREEKNKNEYNFYCRAYALNISVRKIAEHWGIPYDTAYKRIQNTSNYPELQQRRAEAAQRRVDRIYTDFEQNLTTEDIVKKYNFSTKTELLAMFKPTAEHPQKKAVTAMIAASVAQDRILA